MCEDHVDEYRCTCPTGFFGTRCEYVDTNPDNEVPYADLVALGDNRSTTRFPSELREANPKAEELSDKQVLMIVLVSAIVPIMALIAVAVILVCKRKSKSERMRRKEDAEIRMQNEQNDRATMNNNKCAGGPSPTGATVIVNDFERASSMYDLNRQKSATLSSKLSNEDLYPALVYARHRDPYKTLDLNNKAATLQTLQRTRSHKLLNVDCVVDSGQLRPAKYSNHYHDNLQPKADFPSEASRSRHKTESSYLSICN